MLAQASKSSTISVVGRTRRRAAEAELRRLSKPDERAAWIGLLETHDRVVRGIDAELRRAHGLSYRDIEALARIAEVAEGVSMSVLASRILLSPSRVSRLVGALVEARLVSQRPSDEDGRATIVEITNVGRDRLLEAGPTYLTTLNRLLFDHLTRADVAALNRAWRRLDAARKSA
jgi:DNA-binding MarR family transcriptional regulator